MHFDHCLRVQQNIAQEVLSQNRSVSKKATKNSFDIDDANQAAHYIDLMDFIRFPLGPLIQVPVENNTC